MGQKMNQNGNLKKKTSNKYKWKDNTLKPMGWCKNSLKGKFIVINEYIKILESFQISN